MKIQTLLKIIPFVAIVLLSPQSFTSSNTAGFLRVSGDKVLDASDKPILLRGLNIAFKDFKDVLGEADIKKIADTGANSIRLVMNYRDFETSSFEYNKESFSLLNSLLDWCKKYRIYVILDMHLAPGIQNPHDFVVHRERTYEFWKKKEYRKRFYALWAEIAKRYAGRKIIAGYDLLNEGVPPRKEDYIEVMNTAAKSIRSHDKNHILIVQEAFFPDGRKEILPIDDRNTMYSIHFFYPPQFTFFTTTRERTITRYPGEMVTSGDKIDEVRTEALTGSSGWRKLSISAAPPEGAEILMVNISSMRNRGAVWFDDIHLEVDGQPVDLPSPLVPNNSFEIDYPGINWDTKGSCITVTKGVSKTGRYSLALFDCNVHGSAQSSPIEVRRGQYLLSAWYKSEDATGDTHLSLSWHRKNVLKSVDKKALLEKIDYALRFKSKYNVPLYVGEFTAHANPSTDSVINYLKDVLDIMKNAGLHWSYWTYYSEYRGVGIFTGSSPQPVDPERLDVLKRHMQQ